MLSHSLRSLDAVEAVRFALALLPVTPRPPHPPATAGAQGKPCPVCGAVMTEASARWLPVVPAIHLPAPAVRGDGGLVSVLPSALDRFVGCAGCAARIGAADLLDVPLAHPGDLLARRRAILLRAGHHPTRYRDRVGVTRALSARVDQPRVVLTATTDPDGSAVLGWSRRSGGPGALGALVHLLRAAFPLSRLDAPSLTLGGRPVDDGALLWRVPGPHGLDALGVLIDAGALLVPARPVVPTADDARTAWGVRWYSMRQHRDRLDPLTLFPVPLPARSYSDSPGARRMRAARSIG